MEFKIIGMEHEEAIKAVIQDAFSVAPWNDVWDDAEVFHEYILDLVGNRNSLAFGAYDGDQLVGVALGRVKHWYDGNEYCIDDFGIATSSQGKGIGSALLNYIREYAVDHRYKSVTLWTERSAAAYDFYVKNGLTKATGRASFIFDAR